MKRLQTFIYRLLAFFLHIKSRFRQRKQQPPPVHVLLVKQDEKQVQTAFQSHSVTADGTLSAYTLTEHFKQSRQFTVSVSSELRPPPAGVVKILDLCKNYN